MFSGGGNKPKPIDPKTTDYDILFVGKHSVLPSQPFHPTPESATTATYSPRYDGEISGVEVANSTTIMLALVLTLSFRWNKRGCSLEAHPDP